LKKKALQLDTVTCRQLCGYVLIFFMILPSACFEDIVDVNVLYVPEVTFVGTINGVEGMELNGHLAYPNRCHIMNDSILAITLFSDDYAAGSLADGICINIYIYPLANDSIEVIETGDAVFSYFEASSEGGSSNDVLLSDTVDVYNSLRMEIRRLQWSVGGAVHLENVSARANPVAPGAGTHDVVVLDGEIKGTVHRRN